MAHHVDRPEWKEKIAFLSDLVKSGMYILIQMMLQKLYCRLLLSK